MIQTRKTLLLFSLLFCISGRLWATETQGVVVTIKPLHAMVSGVIGHTGKAELLLTGNHSPHGIQLKPSQMRSLQEARVVFYIHDRFETFLARVLPALPPRVRQVPVARHTGLTIYPMRQGGAWDAHDAHQHHAQVHKHEEHAHEHEEHHAHQDAGQQDMHIWLDPQNARKIVALMAQELSAIYPQNRDIYQANAAAYSKKIEALDTELGTLLAGVQHKPFMVFHDAYQYFERAYGLRGIGSITLEPDESPSPKRIKEVRKKLKQTGAQCVFREPQFSDRLVKTVIEGTDAKSDMLDPLGAYLDDTADSYFHLMRNMAQAFVRCFGLRE